MSPSASTMNEDYKYEKNQILTLTWKTTLVTKKNWQDYCIDKY